MILGIIFALVWWYLIATFLEHVRIDKLTKGWNQADWAIYRDVKRLSGKDPLAKKKK